MTQTVYRCPVAMPVETLSAWYDRELNSFEAERVQAHIRTCSACKQQLAYYADENHSVKKFDAPYLQDRIWQGLQQRQASARHRRITPPQGVILGGLGATLVLVILVASFALFSPENRRYSITSVVPTNTLFPTPTIATLKVAPGPNWIDVPTLSFGKSLAFAQSDPVTGYVCGSLEPETNQPLMLSVTHNGGLTWPTPQALPITFSNCAIFVNPSNADDLVIHGTNTWGPVGDGIAYELGTYFRSIDGGKSWAALSLPGTPSEGQLGSVVISQVAWAGSTLFASTHIASQQDVGEPPHLLAASVNNGPLQWVDQTLPFPASHSVNGTISALFGLGQTIYAENHCSANIACFVATSSTGGTSWSKILLPVGVSNIFMGGDHKTLLGSNYSDRIIRKSTDGGHTWTTLVATPYPTTQLVMIPDGTIYGFEIIQNNSQVEEKIYKLSAGATAWRDTGMVNPLISTLQVTQTFSWDIEGHAVAFWRVRLENDNQPGIQYHAP